MVSSLFSADLGEFNSALFNLNQNTNIFEKKIVVDYTGTEEAVIIDEEDENLTLDELLDLVSEIGLDKLTSKQKELLNKFSLNK
jgi:bacterioferritin (cytochrome b1)